MPTEPKTKKNTQKTSPMASGIAKSLLKDPGPVLKPYNVLQRGLTNQPQSKIPQLRRACLPFFCSPRMASSNFLGHEPCRERERNFGDGTKLRPEFAAACRGCFVL